MLAFLQDNAPVISALASLGTVAIWTIYLHIFVQGHRRQLKPMLIINRGEGRDLSARCLITNMSQEPVYIQSVVANLISDGDRYTAYITDAEDIRSGGDPTGWQRLTRQGPLASGMMVDMGSFECILDYAARVNGDAEKFVDSRFRS